MSLHNASPVVLAAIRSSTIGRHMAGAEAVVTPVSLFLPLDSAGDPTDLLVGGLLNPECPRSCSVASAFRVPLNGRLVGDIFIFVATS